MCGLCVSECMLTLSNALLILCNAIVIVHSEGLIESCCDGVVLWCGYGVVAFKAMLSGDV